MNKNYFVVLGVIVVALIIYFVFSSASVYSFDSGLTKINFLWEKQDLKPKYLTSPLKVYSAEKIKLTELKTDLTSFKEKLAETKNSADNEKLDLLLEIQINLIDNALLQKENFELIDFFESNNYDFDVLCSYTNKAELLQENLVLKKNSAESFNEKVIAFSGEFLEEAKKAEINSLSLGISSEEKLSELESMISALKGVC